MFSKSFETPIEHDHRSIKNKRNTYYPTTWSRTWESSWNWILFFRWWSCTDRCGKWLCRLWWTRRWFRNTNRASLPGFLFPPKQLSSCPLDRTGTSRFPYQCRAQTPNGRDELSLPEKSRNITRFNFFITHVRKGSIAHHHRYYIAYITELTTRNEKYFDGKAFCTNAVHSRLKQKITVQIIKL